MAKEINVNNIKCLLRYDESENVIKFSWEFESWICSVKNEITTGAHNHDLCIKDNTKCDGVIVNDPFDDPQSLAKIVHKAGEIMERAIKGEVSNMLFDLYEKALFAAGLPVNNCGKEVVARLLKERRRIYNAQLDVKAGRPPLSTDSIELDKREFKAKAITGLRSLIAEKERLSKANLARKMKKGTAKKEGTRTAYMNAELCRHQVSFKELIALAKEEI